MRDWVIFSIDEQQFAVELADVNSVINAAELTSVPLASETFKGMLNFHGDLIPTFDIRHWLGFPNREISVSDQFIICQRRGRLFALWVDQVAEVSNYPEADSSSIQERDKFSGVIKAEDKLILVLKIDPLFDRTEFVKIIS